MPGLAVPAKLLAPAVEVIEDEAIEYLTGSSCRDKLTGCHFDEGGA